MGHKKSCGGALEARKYIAFYQKKVDERSDYAKELEQCRQLDAYLQGI